MPYSGDMGYFYQIVKMAKQRSYVEMIVNKPKLEVLCQLCHSDASLFPFLWDEPFGYVLIESMVCGVPPIAFKRGAVPEIIKNGVSGFSCIDLDDMVESVLDIKKIDRQNCRQIVKEDFGVYKTYSKYQAIYDKIID